MLIPCDDNEEKLLTSRDSIKKQLPVPCDCSTIIVLVLLVYTSLDNSQHSLRYNTRYLSSLFSFIRFLSFFFFFHSFIFNSLMHLIAYNNVYVFMYVCTKAQSDNFCEEHIRKITFDFDVAFLSIYFRFPELPFRPRVSRVPTIIRDKQIKTSEKNKNKKKKKMKTNDYVYISIHCIKYLMHGKKKNHY